MEKNKITVKLKWNLDETKLYFVNKGMPLIESFNLRDVYLIKDEINIEKTPNSKILSHALIIRENIGNEYVKELIYKEKNESENDSSIEYLCPIVDVDKTYDLLIHIGYKECLRYEQECLTYLNNDMKILIEYVPDLGLFLELENNKSIEDIKEDFRALCIPYYENEWFVKKASLMLDLIKKRRK